MRRLLILAIAIAGLPGIAQAQLTRMRAGSVTTLGMELTKGFYDGGGLAWYTSALRGRLFVPVSPSARFLVDVGISIAGVDEGGTDGTISNPEIGVLFVDDEDEPRGHLTVVLPIGIGFGGDDVSAGTGLLSDFFRPERYLDDLASINAGLTPRTALGSSTELTAEFTASAVIPRGDGDSELFARYGVGVRHRKPAVRLSGGIEGFAILTQGDLSLGERTIHRLVFAIDGTNGGPGFFVQVPIDEELEEIRAVVGMTLAF